MKPDASLPETNFRTDGRLFVSYPKSGRTWVRYALGTSGITITFTHAGAATNKVQIGRPYPGIPDRMRALPMIFLHRNPIDTAVSMYYQVHHKDLRKWSWRWWRVAPRLLRGAGLPPEKRMISSDTRSGASRRSATTTDYGWTICQGATIA